MIIARIHFKPESAKEFLPGGHRGQLITEVAFDSAESLMAFLGEFKEFIVNCTALTNGQIIDLRELSQP